MNGLFLKFCSRRIILHLFYIDNVIVAQVHFLQIFDLRKEILRQRVKPVVIEVQLESVGRQTGRSKLLISQLNTVDLHSVLDKRCYSEDVTGSETDLSGQETLPVSVCPPLVAEAAGRAVGVTVGQCRQQQADQHQHQHPHCDGMAGGVRTFS